MYILNVLLLFLSLSLAEVCTMSTTETNVAASCTEVEFTVTNSASLSITLAENSTALESIKVSKFVQLIISGNRNIDKLVLPTDFSTKIIIDDNNIAINEVRKSADGGGEEEVNFDGILYYTQLSGTAPTGMGFKGCGYTRIYRNPTIASEATCICTKSSATFEEADCAKDLSLSANYNLVETCQSNSITVENNWKSVKTVCSNECTINVNNDVTSLNYIQTNHDSIIKGTSQLLTTLTVELKDFVTKVNGKLTGLSGTCDKDICVYATSASTFTLPTGIQKSTCGTNIRFGKSTDCGCTPLSTIISKAEFVEYDCKVGSDHSSYTLMLSPDDYTLSESLTFSSISGTANITGIERKNKLTLTTLTLGQLTKLQTMGVVVNGNLVKSTGATMKIYSCDVSINGNIPVEASRYLFLDGSTLFFEGVTETCSLDEGCDIITFTSGSTVTVTETLTLKILKSSYGNGVVRVKVSDSSSDLIKCKISKSDSTFANQFGSVYYECPCSSGSAEEANCEYVISTTSFTLGGRENLFETLSVEKDEEKTITISSVVSIYKSNIPGNSITLILNGDSSDIRLGGIVPKVQSSKRLRTIADLEIESTTFEIEVYNTLTIEHYNYGQTNLIIRDTVTVSIGELNVVSTNNKISIDNGKTLTLVVREIVDTNNFKLPVLLFDSIRDRVIFSGTTTDLLSCEGKMLFNEILASDAVCLFYHDYYHVCIDGDQDDCMVSSYDLPKKLIITTTNEVLVNTNFDLYECTTSTCKFGFGVYNKANIISTYSSLSTIVVTSTAAKFNLNVSNAILQTGSSGKTFVVKGNCKGINIAGNTLELHSTIIDGNVYCSNLITTGNVEVKGNIDVTVNANLGDGTITAVNFVTLSVILASNTMLNFTKFKVTGLSNEQTIPDSFLNYKKSIDFTDSKVYPVDSYLKFNSVYSPTYKCYTKSQTGIDLSLSSSFENPSDHGCVNTIDKIVVKSPSVFASSSSTKFQISSDTSFVGLKGTVDMVFEKSCSISVYGSGFAITATGGYTPTITLYNGGSVSGFSIVQISTKETVTIGNSSPVSIVALIDGINVKLGGGATTFKSSVSSTQAQINIIPAASSIKLDSVPGNMVVVSSTDIASYGSFTPKCGKRIFFSILDEANKFVCPFNSIDLTYSGSLPSNPCSDNTIPCSGKIRYSSGSTMDLSGIFAQELILINNGNSDVTVKLPVGIKKLTIENGPFTLTNIPQYLNVSKGTVTAGSPTVDPSANVFVASGANLIINCESDITMKTIESSGIVTIASTADHKLNLYGGLDIKNKLSLSNIHIYSFSDVSPIYIQTLELKTNYGATLNSVFMMMGSSTNFTIDVVTRTGCCCVANFRNVKGLLDGVSVKGAESKHNIYYFGCSESDVKLTECGVDKESVSGLTVDISSSSSFEVPSVCPSSDLPIICTDLGSDPINIIGFEGAYDNKITLPQNAKIQYSGSTNLSNVVMGASLEISDNFIIQKLDGSGSIVIDANDVQINTVSSSSIITVNKNRRLTVTEDITVTDLIIATGTSEEFVAKNKLTVSNDLKIDTTGKQSNFLVSVNSIKFPKITLSPSVTGYTAIPLIKSNGKIPVTGVQLGDASVVCMQENVIALVSVGSYYICTEPYECVGSDVCTLSSDSKFKQQIIYSLTGTSLSFDDNQLTNLYDIIKLSTPNTNIEISGGTYYIYSASKGNIITCIGTCNLLVETENSEDFVILKGSGITVKDSQKQTYIEIVDVNNQFSFTGISNTQFHLTATAGIVKFLGVNVFNELIVNGAEIQSDASFDVDKVTYISGTFSLTTKSAIASMSQFYYNATKTLTGNCDTLITHSPQYDNLLSFKIANIYNNKEDTIDLISCGGIVLRECKKTATPVDYDCHIIECPATGDLPSGCYCTYSMKTKQSCVLKCSDTEVECNVNDPVQSSLFSEITGLIEKVNFETVASVYSLNLTPTEYFVATSLNVYQLEGTSDAKMTIKGSNLVIDSISLGIGSLTLGLPTGTRRIKMTGGSITLNSIVTFPETNEPLVEIEGNTEAKERGIEIDGSNLIFGAEGKIVMKGGIDGTYTNKITIRNTNIQIDSSRNISDIIVIENGGDIVFDKVTVTITGEAVSRCFNLVKNNDIERITLSSSTGIEIDSQKYILSACAGGAVPTISELACSLNGNDNYVNVKSSDWERATCPCEGSRCIIDFNQNGVVTYSLIANKTYDALKVYNDKISLDNNNITRVLALGGSSNINMKDSIIETLRINGTSDEVSLTISNGQNDGNKVKNIIGNGINSNVWITNGHTSIESIEKVSIGVKNAGYLKIDKPLNFKSQKLAVEKTYVDIYNSEIDFSDSTISLTCVQGNSANLNFDDDVNGKTIESLKESVIKVYYDSSIETGLFAAIRFPAGASVKLTDYDLEAIDSNKATKAADYVFKAACQGIILTNLEDNAIVCPTDRLARSTETTEFPSWTIAIIVIFVVVLLLLIVIMIAYAVYVYLQRKRNLKVFEEGEEIDVDTSKEEKKEEVEIKN